jgi:hypothetical protein
MFAEPHTAVYDSLIVPWTYLQPVKVNVELMPAPEAKYYQRLTKKPWDISSSEWVEMSYRKRFLMACWYTSFIVSLMFILPKEKSFSGLKGSDGWYIALPKNRPELFA